MLTPQTNVNFLADMKHIFLTFALIQQPVEALNPIDLILEAGWVVQGVMILLLAASFISWFIIFYKWFLLKGVTAENLKFADNFWAAGTLEGAARASKAFPQSPLTRIFETGIQEYNQIAQLKLAREDCVELLETNMTRSLQKAIKIETEQLMKSVSFLANTASAAPFIGLFGTVWGIMNSFISIGATGASNLAVVAPGIAEALIATAMGLFAAIPAVLFYNLFISKIKVLTSGMNHFATDFLNTAKRSL